MKIIIVGTAYPYRGGLAAYNERLAREYIAQGHDVEIYTFKLQYPAFLFPGKTQLSEEPMPTDIVCKRAIHSISPLNWLKVGAELRRKKADKIIFCYWMAFMAPCFGTIARIARKSGAKCIALVHNMIPHEPTILDKLFPKYFVDAMDGFVTMAESVREDVKHFDKASKPIAVSPHPIYDHYGPEINKNEAAEKLELAADVNYILFFGFIRQYKGLDLLLEAFADERLRKLNVQLIVAGEFYENPQPYLKSLYRLKIEDFVELRSSFIPDNEVANYFSIADIVAQPYRSATQSGVSQIAYHFEKPMLVTDVGGLAEIVPHQKVGYVTDVNVTQIADALVDFFENKRAAEFIENIKVEKKKYAWSKMTEVIDQLFK